MFVNNIENQFNGNSRFLQFYPRFPNKIDIFTTTCANEHRTIFVLHHLSLDLMFIESIDISKMDYSWNDRF